jgi:hypothetical protein
MTRLTFILLLAVVTVINAGAADGGTNIVNYPRVSSLSTNSFFVATDQNRTTNKTVSILASNYVTQAQMSVATNALGGVMATDADVTAAIAAHAALSDTIAELEAIFGVNLLTSTEGDAAYSPLTIDASGFNGNLTTGTTNLQQVAQALDDLSAAGGDAFPLSEDADANGHSITNFGTLSGDTLEVDELVVANAGAGIIGKTNWTAGRLLMGNGTGTPIEVVIGSGLTSATNSGAGTHTLTSDGGSGTAGITGSGSTENNDDFTTLYTYTFPATNLTAQLGAHVLGAGPTNVYGFNVAAVVQNIDGTATIVGTNNTYIIPAAGTNITAYWTVSDDEAQLVVRGTESENVNWVATNILVNVVTNGSVATAETSYLINQGFEGSGYDNSESWSETSGSPNEDSTTSPIVGSQSLRISGAVAVIAKSPSFTAQSTLYVYFRMRTSGNPGGGRRFFYIRDSSNNVLLECLQNSTGTVTARAGTSGGSTTSGTLSASTDYHCWVKYVKGTGANAVAEFGFSTDGVRPTTGANFISDGSGSAAVDADHIAFGNNAAQVIPTWDFDRVLVDDAVIGDNP